MCSAPGPARDARRSLLPTAAVALAACSLLLSACGGGSAANQAAQAGSTTTPTMLAYSRCMRASGVPGFPDPDGSGHPPKREVVAAAKGDQEAFTAAQKACRHLLPNGGDGPTPAEVQREAGELRAFARCMRRHGLTSFPDPTTDSHGRPIFDLQAAGVDESSPQLRSTARQCQSLLHLSRLPPVTG